MLEYYNAGMVGIGKQYADLMAVVGEKSGNHLFILCHKPIIIYVPKLKHHVERSMAYNCTRGVSRGE